MNVGDVLAGKYQVDRVLGIGGMGMVVAATHVELDQKVAIKFMLPTALANTSATERFLREARAVVKLRSEHVCRVFDVGRLNDGAPYIVMELMDGFDLSQVLETRRILPVAEAVDLVMQALEGIAEAHANSIVHRDLKPANLFIASDSDGSPLVKVLDFGISKSSVGGSATKTGEIMGSPSYMAPEQMQSSKDVDVRADIWAIGVILYEATTGMLPFASENLPALCMQVMFDPVPPMQGVSPAFAAVVMRSLAKAASERYDDLGAFAMALAPYGTPDAAAGATRIVKVLRRTKGPDAPATPWTAKTVSLRPEERETRESQGPQVSSTAEPAAIPAVAAASAVRQSTLSGSASESLRVGGDKLAHVEDLDGVDVPARRPRWMLPAAFVGAAAVAVVAVVGVTSLSRKHREPTAAPAAAPAVIETSAPAGSATAEVQPAPPPTAPPVTTPAPTAPATAGTPTPVTTPTAPVADSTQKASSKKTGTAVRVTSPTGAPPVSSTPTKATTTPTSPTTTPTTTTAATPPPPVTTPPPPAGTTAGSAATETTPDGKPIYKGTKGKIITTYPTE